MEEAAVPHGVPPHSVVGEGDDDERAAVESDSSPAALRMREVFGENGRHARSAVGMAELPFSIPVEIEMILEVE